MAGADPRRDGRANDALRSISLARAAVPYAEGSCLVAFGETRVLCAVSVGIVGGELRADLDYAEDVRADVDMNVVMSSEGRFVEVQGTGERGTFGRAELDELLALATRAIAQLDAHQRLALGRG